ncbi:Protein ABA AND ROS SENSITIVE 1 [Linum perenne]
MDKKALFRAKLNAQKKVQRIDSPLVRYNESDQPVCRVCNFLLKESQWDAHQASRKHREAIDKLKANAAARTNATKSKPESRSESSRVASTNNADLHAATQKAEPPTKPSEPQSSSSLPPNFFDSHGPKSQKTGANTDKLADSDPHTKLNGALKPKTVEPLSEDKLEAQPRVNNTHHKTEEVGRGQKPSQTDVTQPENKSVKGSLPEGFFDNQEADLRARGIKIVKPDVKDEYKEFEKLIQEDLLEVDDRLEEEEIDAAEKIEEAETVEQKTYMEKGELLKRKKMELKSAKSAKRSKGSRGGTEVAKKESSDEDSSSDGDSESEGNFALDWRAQHL